MQSQSKFQCLFHRNRKTNPAIQMEAQKIPDSQSNPEQEKNNAVDIMVPDFKLFCRATVTKNSMALAQKQTCRPME
jgi:hypothetical protein